MKIIRISSFQGSKSKKNGKKLKVFAHSDQGEVLALAFPHELELDLVLPLQMASNEAAIRRGLPLTGCHRSMRPSKIRVLTDTCGKSVLQLVFDGRNKLDILIPSEALARLCSTPLAFHGSPIGRKNEVLN